MTVERREHAGLRALTAELDVQGRPTQLRVELTCPFCAAVEVAYLWSLSGSGKRCHCGALLTTVAAYGPRGGADG